MRRIMEKVISVFTNIPRKIMSDGEDQDKHCLVDLISDHDRIVVYHAVRYCDHEAERR
mgnify:CR=1 FL=1